MRNKIALFVDNPTLDIKQFREGDFVSFLDNGRQHYGVVRGIPYNQYSNSITIVSFETGFLNVSESMPSEGRIVKISKEEALKAFKALVDKFESESRQGTLLGAIAARKKFNIDNVLESMASAGLFTEEGLTKNFPNLVYYPPQTGIYAVRGVYSGNGPSNKYLQGLKTVPRLDESRLVSVLNGLYPEGFGGIPYHGTQLEGTSGGTLVTYDAIEIPEKALSLVINPKKLEISF